MNTRTYSDADAEQKSADNTNFNAKVVRIWAHSHLLTLIIKNILLLVNKFLAARL